MKDVTKKYFIANPFNGSIWSESEYPGVFTFRDVSLHWDNTILYFEAKEDAEKYIYDHNVHPSTIVELFA